MYIIVSSFKSKAKNILAKNLSLLFGNFEVINVEPFSIKTSEEYLEYKLGGLNIDAALKSFLVHFTGGIAFYLKVISDTLKKEPKSSLVDTLEEQIFNSSGILNQRFSNYIRLLSGSAGNPDYISVLYLISSGRNKIKDIAHIMRKNQKELSLIVGRLTELDAISRNGDFLKVSDRVFGFWLRFVYQEKLQSLTFDARNQKIKFRDYIDGLLEEFSRSAKRTVSERMLELLRQFEDDVMQVEAKKIRLSHFREVKALEFNHKTIREGILGRSSESIWIMAIKTGHLSEEDISAFAKECKKYRHKQQRKIMVTLKDIDPNTRLKAMEEKIWTWDLDNLNKILDLYSKPWVIA